MTAAARRLRASARGAGLLAAVGVAALAPAGPSSAGGLGHLAAAAVNQLYVAVVVDFGGAGAPAAVVRCVKVDQGATGAQALALAVGSQNVGYNDAGLVCSIDGYPVNGVADCTATSGDEYYFWAYFHGTSGQWVYSATGPAFTEMTPGGVEGWRFEDPGPDNASAPPPARPPTFSAICPAVYVSTPTTPTTSAVTTTTAAPGSTGPGGASGSSPATATTAPTTTGPAHPLATTDTVIPASAGSRNHRAAGHPASAGGTIIITTTTTTNNKGRGGAATAPAPRALSGAPTRRPGAGGHWLIDLAAGLLVVVLAAAAAVRWRRRLHP